MESSSTPELPEITYRVSSFVIDLVYNAVNFGDLQESK